MGDEGRLSSEDMTAILAVPRAAEFLALIEARLREKTYRHSIATTHLMLSLADGLDITPEQAATAGLLHDLGKSANGPELLERANAYELFISDAQRDHPKLLHGVVAAEECRRDLGITDEAVLDAICWHTTGRPGLGDVGLALYLADYAEPLRTHPNASVARAILDTDGFVAALLFVSTQKLAYVRTRPHMDPVTETFHAWLVEFAS